MIEQLPLISYLSTRCAWCGKSVDPVYTEQVAVLEDPLDIELVTGYETVCNICLEVNPLEIELETDMITYHNYWQNDCKYEYVEV